MNTIKKGIAVLLTFVMIFTSISIPSEAKKTVSLEMKAITVFEGMSITIRVKNASAKKTSWKSSNTKVATVKAGKITAKKKGTATITAKVSKKKLKCKVTVVEKQEEKSVIDVASPEWVTKLPAAESATELVVVASPNEKSSGAWFSYHEKAKDGTWHMKVTTPCFVGKEGIGKTKEGDSKTPVGTFTFTDAFGNAPDPGCRMKYVQATQYTYWSGDPNYKYNQMIEDYRQHPDLDITKCDEHIVDYPIHYQYCLNISYNKEGTPGAGSGIFLHCFAPGKPWTGGCVSIPYNRLKYIMTRVNEQSMIVIDTIDNLGGDWPANILS